MVNYNKKMAEKFSDIDIVEGAMGTLKFRLDEIYIPLIMQKDKKHVSFLKETQEFYEAKHLLKADFKRVAFK